MDLLSIARKIWRYKLLTVPVVLLMLCGAVYVVAIKQPVYQASSSYILINPPAPPTPEQIARDPALGRIHADNPYTRFSDQTVVVQVLSSSMANESVKRALLKAGADPRYKVEPDSGFGFSSPILKVTAQGTTPEVALKSAELVGNALIRELQGMQQAQGVDPQYRIRANKVSAPDGAQLQASGQLRALVGVLGLGTILLFVVVSVGDAITNLRMERAGRSAASPLAPTASPLAPHDQPWPPEEGQSAGLSALDPGDWSEFEEGQLSGADPVEPFPDQAPDALNGSSARGLPQPRNQYGSGH
jgi:hypothetical protein